MRLSSSRSFDFSSMRARLGWDMCSSVWLLITLSNIPGASSTVAKVSIPLSLASARAAEFISMPTPRLTEKASSR